MSPPEGLARRPVACALAALLITGALSPFALNLEIDNGLERWVDRSGAAWREYRDFQEKFGSDEFVLLIYAAGRLDEPAFVERLGEARRRLEILPFVARTFCLSRVAESLRLDDASASLLQAVSRPAYRNLLLSDDGRWGATLLALSPRAADRRGESVAEIERILEEERLSGEIRLAGAPVLNVALDRASRRASETFLPLVFTGSGVLLLLLFRSIWGVLLPFFSVGTGISWTLGAMALSGRPLDMVTVSLPPLVWVLGLSTSIHLLSRHGDHLSRGLEPAEAARATLVELWRPCLYSAVTTAVGFATLAASSLRPVRDMGIFASVGILACLASNLLLFPLLSRCHRGKPQRDRFRHRLASSLADLAARRGTRILIPSAIVFLLLAAGLPRLSVDSDVLDFLAENDPVVRTYRGPLADLTGPYTLEIVLEPGEGKSLAETVPTLSTLTHSLSGLPGAARVLSPLDFAPSAGGPGLAEAGSLSGATASAGGANPWYDPATGALRVSVLATSTTSSAHHALLAGVQERLDVLLPSSWRASTTGVVDLLVDLQDRIVRGQVRSLGIALAVMVTILSLILRSLPWILASLPPNLLPVLAAFGAMGHFGIPLDPATAMIASVALGIAVDDTIHFLERYRHARSRGSGRDAVAEALAIAGRPMVLTTIVAALGFLILCFSEFRPLVHFGLISAVALFAALLGDLLLLPALLCLGSPEAEGPRGAP